MTSIVNTPFRGVLDYPGSGKTVVLLHGFLSSKEYWTDVSRLLNNYGYRVIAIDLLGFGDAPKPKDISYGYDDHMLHINAVLSKLDVQTDFILVGHSMGALLAMRYAKEYPSNVSRLALFNPPMYRNAHQVNKTLRATGFIYRLLLDSRYRHILWIILRTIGTSSKHNRYSREGSLKNVINLAHFFDDLEMIKITTLLFIGKRDRGVYIENLFKEGTGKNVKIIIEDTDHHAPKTNAKSVVDHILFITS